ncbi:MAG: TonB-dependent receptor plug domain-containing protein [Chitinophagaceae bacterium]
MSLQLLSQDTTNSTNSKMLDNVIIGSNDIRISNTEVSVNKLNVNVSKKIPVVFGEADILKTLQLLPGVTNTGDGAVGFNVRGGGTDQNLILLDNAPIYSAAHALGVFSVFNSFALKDFKLYKGGIPVEYGDRLASVLDITQITGNKKGWDAVGNIGLIASNLLVEGPFYKRKNQEQANNSFFIAGRRTYADLFLPLVNDKNVKTSKVYFYDLNAKVDWDISPKDNLSASGYYGEDFIKLASIAMSGWGNALASVNWNHVYNSQWNSNISAAYSRFSFYLESENGGLSTKWNANINNYILSGLWNYKINDNIKIKFGYQFNYYDIFPGLTTVKDNKGTTLLEENLTKKNALQNTLFASLTQSITPKLKIEYGLRYINYMRLGLDTIWQYLNNQPIVYDANTKIYSPGIPTTYKAYKKGEIEEVNNLFEPRINAVYIFDNTQSLKLGYNRINQPIQLVTNTSTTLPANYYVMSNKYIPIEYADQISLGYFKNLGRNSEYEISTEMYYKSMRNLIDYIDGANILSNNYVETEMLKTKGFAYGIELMVAKNIGKFTGWISYTYSRSLRKTENSVIGSGINNKQYYPAPYDIPHVGNVVLTYDVTPRIAVSGLFTFRSGLPTTYPVGQYYVFDQLITQYSDRNANRLKPYHRLDLSVAFKSKPRKHWEGKFVISIYNVYNRLNPVSIYFNDQQAYEIGYYRIVPSISYEFKIK